MDSNLVINQGPSEYIHNNITFGDYLITNEDIDMLYKHIEENRPDGAYNCWTPLIIIDDCLENKLK